MTGSLDLIPEVGGWYWVAGKGPMELVELPDPPGHGRKTTVTLRTLHGTTYWAGPAELHRLAPSTFEHYLAELVRVNLPSGWTARVASCRAWIERNST